MVTRAFDSTAVQGGNASGEGQTPVHRLASLERQATPAEALAFFDSLHAIPADEMLGAWQGSGLPTGSPLDGMLELYGWHGKRFEGPEDVHPLVMGEPGARFSLNPSLLPLSLLRRHASLLKSPAVVAVAKRLMWLLKTRKPKARLRLMEFRGVSSAAMVYDALPVIDVFRKVDTDTVLGLMDVRGEAPPALFYFVLRREREPTTARRP
jgi:hypothetical protein